MNWGLLRLEVAVSAWILLMLGADLIVPAPRKHSLWGLALCGVVVFGVILWAQPPAWLGRTFQDMFLVDRFSGYFKALFLIATGVVIVMTREWLAPPRAGAPEGHSPAAANAGAFYMLLFTALLGMLVLASVNDLVLLFLGLELLTFSLYIMTAYLRTDARSVEAGMKYLIIGSVSSGVLVYGVALLYGAAGSTSFPALRALFADGTAPLTAQAGLLLVVAGLGFKIAAVPFHLWAPDVYEGAPTPVVALLSVGSKTAGIVAMLRLLFGVALPLQWLWADLLAVLAAATMCYGNLAAIPQTNIKRLLGYSAIGHAGYLLLGLATASRPGAEAVGYYLLAYLVSALAVFLVVVLVAGTVGSDALAAYRGLARRSGLLAAALFVGLLSLAGVPPLAGFVGKWLVLLAAAQAGRLWLVALGAVNVVLALYYYLLIVKRMYLEPPTTPTPVAVSPLTQATLGLLLVGILVLGIWPAPFVALIAAAFRP
jgi:NADH-quinone oxidoreductase subunit N